nr:MAG TPA: hypothetical protein [Caudoviricetes sp.]
MTSLFIDVSVIFADAHYNLCLDVLGFLGL